MRQSQTDRQASGEIKLDALSVVFGQGAKAVRAVDRVSATMTAGEFVCLLGPSGCGKSTVMNVIAGFEAPTEGEAMLDSEPIIGPGPDRGMVFQKPTLFPWKSVRDNVAHGPRMQGLSTREARAVADEFLALVGLRNFADSRPETLSGGMQQRVGIARALAPRPKVLLMDEPFGALDAQTRSMMQENLLQIWVEQRPTVLFVTHDIDEAIFLADRVLIMSARPGRIVEEIKVTLPRPRDPSVLLTPEFLELKQLCYGPVRRESLRSFEQGSSATETKEGV